jgi:hypothetical protein
MKQQSEKFWEPNFKHLLARQFWKLIIGASLELGAFPSPCPAAELTAIG